MDEDHQEDGEQDEEEGQGSETYAAQSNKAAKKVKNFTEVMQRPDSAFCASKARRKQQLGAAQTRGRNPKKIQGSRVADVKKGTLMKRPEKYPGEGLKVVAGCLVSCSCFIFNFHLNIPQTTPSCARGVSASSWPSRWLVARGWSVAWSMHTRRLSYLYLVLAIANNHPDCSLCQRQMIMGIASLYKHKSRDGAGLAPQTGRASCWKQNFRQLRVKVTQKCLKPDDPKHLGATNFNGIFMNI